MDYCCTECFSNKFLKNHILQNGDPIEECYFCNSKGKFGIEASKLQELFTPLIELYTPMEGFYSTESLKEMDLSENMLYDILAWDWDIFEDSDLALPILDSIFWFNPAKGEESRVDVAVELVDYDPYKDSMGIAEDDKNYDWRVFCNEIRHVSRFHPKTFNSETFTAIASANKFTLFKDSIMFRARIQNDMVGFPSENMSSPPPKLATFGRMNPQGISYLYLSNLEDVCIAEVRPNNSDLLSIGTFKAVENLVLMDAFEPFLCPFLYRNNLLDMYKAQSLLFGLSIALSTPINPKDSYLEYLPTQYICEFIKSLGFDGIKYKSSQGEGYNFALFSDDNVVCTKVKTNLPITIQYKSGRALPRIR